MENQPEEQLTEEQMKERKALMLKFFTDQIPFLEEQKKYETLVTEVEELRARRVRAQVMIAQVLAPEPQEKEESKEQPKERKLKTQ